MMNQLENSHVFFAVFMRAKAARGRFQPCKQLYSFLFISQLIPNLNSDMGGKSKQRYFQHNSRPRSPNNERPQPKYEGHSSRFADNKSASERFKKSIQEQTGCTSKLQTVPIRLSVEEQAKRVNAIDEINLSSFQAKTFMRTRNAVVNLHDIPLPRDESSWRENAKLLIDPSVSYIIYAFCLLVQFVYKTLTYCHIQQLYRGSNADGRKQTWMDNLAKLQKEMISESFQ